MRGGVRMRGFAAIMLLSVLVLLIVPIFQDDVAAEQQIWPVCGMDSGHAGLSAYQASDNPGGLAWQLYSEPGSGGQSQPVIAPDGRILYTGTGPNGGLLCVSPNGSLLWSFRGVGTSLGSPGIAPDGTAYFASGWSKNQEGETTGEGYLYAFYPNGTEKWRYPCIGSKGPVVVDDNGIIHFISLGEGRQDVMGYYSIWPNGTLKLHIEGSIDLGYTPTIGPDGTCYFSRIYDYWEGTELVTEYRAIEARTSDGQNLWNFVLDQQSLVENRCIRSPIVLHPSELVLVGLWNGSVLAFDHHGSQVWRFHAEGVVQNGFAIANDESIYFCTAEDLYDDEHQFPGEPNGAPQYLYKISKTGELIWRREIPGWISSTPSISSDGMIFLLSGDSLLAYRQDGTLAWRQGGIYINNNFGSMSGPAIGSDGTIYVVHSGGLCAFSTGRPATVEGLTLERGQSVIRLRWSPPTTDGGSEITGYEVLRTKVGVDGWNVTTIAHLSSSVREYSDKDVQPDSQYQYWVVAENAYGNGAQDLGVFADTYSAIQNISLPLMMTLACLVVCLIILWRIKVR